MVLQLLFGYIYSEGHCLRFDNFTGTVKPKRAFSIDGESKSLDLVYFFEVNLLKQSLHFKVGITSILSNKVESCSCKAISQNSLVQKSNLQNELILNCF